MKKILVFLCIFSMANLFMLGYMFYIQRTEITKRNKLIGNFIVIRNTYQYAPNHGNVSIDDFIDATNYAQKELYGVVEKDSMHYQYHGVQ